jgi:hypothetical protein
LLQLPWLLAVKKKKLQLLPHLLQWLHQLPHLHRPRHLLLKPLLALLLLLLALPCKPLPLPAQLLMQPKTLLALQKTQPAQLPMPPRRPLKLLPQRSNSFAGIKKPLLSGFFLRLHFL